MIHICNYSKGVHILIGHHRRFPYIAIYTITWLLCPFSLVVDSDRSNDTHRWRQIHVSRLVFLFSCRQNTSINFWILLNKTNGLHHRRRHNVHKEQQWRHSTSSRVVRFCSLHAVSSSVIYYSTHTQKCNLFVIYMLA